MNKKASRKEVEQVVRHWAEKTAPDLDHSMELIKQRWQEEQLYLAALLMVADEESKYALEHPEDWRRGFLSVLAGLGMLAVANALFFDEGENNEDGADT